MRGREGGKSVGRPLSAAREESFNDILIFICLLDKFLPSLFFIPLVTIKYITHANEQRDCVHLEREGYSRGVDRGDGEKGVLVY